MNAGSEKKRRLIGPPIGLGLAALLVAAGLAAPAAAQGPLETSGAFGPFFGGAVIDSGYHASTPAESFLRGRAALIRSQGEFNLLTSEAAINAEEARSRAIENSEKAVDTYFRIRQMNRDYRREMRGPRPSAEDFEKLAEAAKPEPLSPSELDTLTGRVRWPMLLRADRFAGLRLELEELLDRWAVSRNLGQTGSFSTEEHLAVRKVTDQLEEELRENVHNLPPQEYTTAKRFLRSLEYQVLQPEESSGLSLAGR